MTFKATCTDILTPGHKDAMQYMLMIGIIIFWPVSYFTFVTRRAAICLMWMPKLIYWKNILECGELGMVLTCNLHIHINCYLPSDQLNVEEYIGSKGLEQPFCFASKMHADKSLFQPSLDDHWDFESLQCQTPSIRSMRVWMALGYEGMQSWVMCWILKTEHLKMARFIHSIENHCHVNYTYIIHIFIYISIFPNS